MAASPTAAQRARFAQGLDRLAPPGRMLALAVSGGPDSLALLLLAHAARPGMIAAATVDHGLRKEAAAEARMVSDACHRLGVPHWTLPVIVPESPSGVQAAARAARYAALARWGQEVGAIALATAHHVDDQAETVLMRLARGAGLAGLAGVRPMRALEGGLSLIRPLLGWRRAELGSIVTAAGLKPVDDPSNHDPRFDRTRARALLAQGWPEPARLAAVAAHLRDAEEALAWAADREFAHRAELTAGGVVLDPEGLPMELLLRVVKRALDHVAQAAGEGHPPPLPGPELVRFVARLGAGEHATLGLAMASPGPRWTFAVAPPHRTG